MLESNLPAAALHALAVSSVPKANVEFTRMPGQLGLCTSHYQKKKKKKELEVTIHNAQVVHHTVVISTNNFQVGKELKSQYEKELRDPSVKPRVADPKDRPQASKAECAISF